MAEWLPLAGAVVAMVVAVMGMVLNIAKSVQDKRDRAKQSTEEASKAKTDLIATANKSADNAMVMMQSLLGVASQSNTELTRMNRELESRVRELETQDRRREQENHQLREDLHREREKQEIDREKFEGRMRDVVRSYEAKIGELKNRLLVLEVKSNGENPHSGPGPSGI